MDVHQLLAQFLEYSQRHGGVVDEGTAFAGGCQFTTHDGIGVVILYLVFIEQWSHVVAREVEVGLDDALVGSLLDGFRVGTLPQQQPDGSEDDALSCSRLTSND